MRFAECPRCGLLTPVTGIVGRVLLIGHNDAENRWCRGSGEFVALSDVWDDDAREVER